MRETAAEKDLRQEVMAFEPVSWTSAKWAVQEIDRLRARVARLEEQIRNTMGLDEKAIQEASIDSGKTIDEVFEP